MLSCVGLYSFLLFIMLYPISAIDNFLEVNILTTFSLILGVNPRHCLGGSCVLMDDKRMPSIHSFKHSFFKACLKLQYYIYIFLHIC